MMKGSPKKNQKRNVNASNDTLNGTSYAIEFYGASPKQDDHVTCGSPPPAEISMALLQPERASDQAVCKSSPNTKPVHTLAKDADSDLKCPTMHNSQSTGPQTRQSRHSNSPASTSKAVKPKPTTQTKRNNHALSKRDWKCCNRTFSKMASFERHIKRTHSALVENPGIACSKCGKLFMHKDNLVQHQKSHKKRKTKKNKTKIHL